MEKKQQQKEELEFTDKTLSLINHGKQEAYKDDPVFSIPKNIKFIIEPRPDSHTSSQ